MKSVLQAIWTMTMGFGDLIVMIISLAGELDTTVNIAVYTLLKVTNNEMKIYISGFCNRFNFLKIAYWSIYPFTHEPHGDLRFLSFPQFLNNWMGPI